ncbi:hypothetical protein BGX28_001160 [Mortierella sp. GBA30]|nr:hypothetical protein BGX28_001160 [Mortierella sp. GBA30]
MSHSIEAAKSEGNSPLSLDSKTPASLPHRVQHHRRVGAYGGHAKPVAFQEHSDSAISIPVKQLVVDSSPRPAAVFDSDSGSASSTIPLMNKKPPHIPTANPSLSQNGMPRTSVVPAPPPKPKRISLAPQPKAKPLSLQSAPLLPKNESLSRQDISASTTTTPITPSIGTKPTVQVVVATPTLLSSLRMQSLSKAPEVIRVVNVNEGAMEGSRSPPVKKPRSTESSIDGGPKSSPLAVALPQFHPQFQPGSAPPSSCSLPGHRAESGNPTLINARSRLRSASDAKASSSTSPTLAYPQTARSPTTTTFAPVYGGHLEHESMINKGHSHSVATAAATATPLLPPTYPPCSMESNGGFSDSDEGSQQQASSAAAAAALTASLQKIQALAHEQTERMKHINYAEKKADLAEVVYEKSSLWRARGAEWSGLAKKAWDDRGGMGGIAGGLADRWKRRADGHVMNDGMPDDSRPAITDRIFGLPLEDAVKFSKISASTGVPAVVTRCIEYLDIMGVEEVGLYRVSGSTTNVARLKALFDHGHDYDFLQKGNEPQNPHDVATLLKLYLRELPSSIIPLETISTFNNIEFSDPQKQTVQSLRNALRLLPLENYVLLGTLCQHLSNLADYENCTKMNISNLGLIFCPTLQIGSVLFKNLLGGDGGEVERRTNLLLVWEDLDQKHEEMENLEMIKDFEMGLEFEKSVDDQTFFSEASPQKKEQRSTSNAGQQGQAGEECFTRPIEEWEDIDRNLLDFSSPSPPHVTSMPLSSAGRHTKGDSGSKQVAAYVSPPASFCQFASHMKSPMTSSTFNNVIKTPEQPPDLYDELMTRELNEATNTPLIDFGLDEEQDLDRDQQAFRWRRHAREPAINRLSDSPPRNTVRHERLPAASLRF